MALKAQQSDAKHFVIKRSEFNTAKLFAEFYLPEYQTLLNTLHQGRYPLRALREVCTRIFDGPFGSDRKVDMYQESGIPYVRVKQVQHEGIDLSGLVYISQEKHESLIRSRVVPGNVLMTIAGSQLGKAAVFPDSFKEGNITGHIVGIEVKDDINPYYLAVFINSRFGKEQVTRWSHRSTRRELNLQEVGQILVSIPPRPLQARIVWLMQNAYTMRKEKLIEAEKIDFYISNYVLEKLGINWREIEDIKQFSVPISELRGSRFDVRYQSPRAKKALALLERSSYPLYSLGKLIEQIHYGASVKNDYTDDGIPFIRIGNLKPNYLDVTDVVYFDESQRNLLGKAFVKKEDLLMSRSGSVGIVAVVPPEADGFAFGSFQIKFRLRHSSANPFFVAYLLNSPIGNAQVEQQKTGSIQMNITIEGIKALKVPLPSIEIQDEIVQEADEQRAEAKRLRAEAETIVSEAKARVEKMILGEEDGA